ncbi:RNA-binding protein 25 [Babesia microti strain RI]|uniref:RNA-binding protein 25 n=1 Tax=Babesia microti (strain RI) TaxID=1133968 RepID=A0A1N6LX42_BABMR|nr:RNA-binding protein 25 [Babesia microti strain RI]SIO73431.1 RNA-binding protein 25 [Babesia microti strain RI]|eukprot:XP_021337530.1 RNA-binding protein 25 [Babesia microti strain RI]
MYFFPPMFVPPPPNAVPKTQYMSTGPLPASTPVINQSADTSSGENTVDLIVYIGNLPIKLSNEAAINILQKCGPLTHWRRQSDPTNDTFATFGFCQFADCQGAHNAMTLLAGLELQKKPIKVSCNDKVKYQLAGWLAKREAHLLDHAEEEPAIKAAEAAVKKDLQGLLAEQDILLERESRRLKALYDDRLKRRETESTNSIDTNDDSARKKKKNEEDKLDYSYLSKDYKVHWKENERLNRIRHKDKEAFTTFLRTEREWIKDEERMFKYVARKRELGGQITDRDREKAMKEDEYTDCILDRDMIRYLAREKRLDAEDYQDEVRSLEEEKNELLAKEKLEEERRRKVAEEQKQIEMQKKMEEEMLKQMQEQKKLEEEKTRLIEQQNIERQKKLEEERKQMPTVKKFTFVPKPIATLSKPKEAAPIKTFFNEDSGDTGENSTRTKTLAQSKIQENSASTMDPKTIMAMVPKQMNEILDYKIDWNLVQVHDIINNKLKPWIRKKIIDYMGNDEKLVTQVLKYILSRISEHKNPSHLLEDVERFLDQEATPFVMGLWRLLIFEILCKSHRI